MKRLALATITLLLTFAASAVDKQYVYTQISHEEGLTSTVNCIYKEKDGDVWVGTPSGLYCFNGHTLINYGAQLEDCKKVFEVDMDKTGALWILTDKHLFRRAAEDETFKRVTQNEDAFYCMTYDDAGIWIGGIMHIYRYTYSDNKLRIYSALPKNFSCRHIEMLDSNTLLCCSQQGKYLFDISDKTYRDAPYGESQEVSALRIDSRGYIWMAFYNKGIEVFHRDGTTLKSYNTANSSLSNNIVLTLAEKNYEILAGTDGGGINIIDPVTGAIKVLSHISGDSTSLPAHSIKSLHVDYYGNIWAGSVHKGLISISQSDMHFYTDAHLGLSCGLSDPTVLCLHQDKATGQIWIGTDGEGINRYDPKTSKFTHYSSTFKSKVVSIADYSDTELAISISGDNIRIFNKATGATRPININDKIFQHSIKHSGQSINITNEYDGDLLLFSNSIYRYDKRTGRCLPISINGKKKIASDLLTIGRTKDGTWFHADAELYFLKDNAVDMTLKGRHEHGTIRCGHLATNGTIWMATEEGLCRYDTQTGEFSYIKTKIFSEANSVICDKRSRVWVGTEKRLAAYLAESGSFAVFGESDGAVPNEYLPKPHLLASNGDVYLGGVHGLLHIKSTYDIDASEKPALKLSGTLIDDARVSLDKKTHLHVERDDKLLRVEISVQEKDLFRHRAYRFTLGQLTYETSSPTFMMKLMPKPGKYPLSVSCTKRNGKWTDPVYLMTLCVPRPWFLSWWFISIVIFLLSGIYFTAIYGIKRRKDSELKMVIKEREQKVYEEKVNMLINISHELRTPLTLIMAPLKRLLKSMSTLSDGYPVLSRVYRQSRRMQSLLDMVLDLQKIEEGGNHLKIENVNFNTWIATCADDIVNEEKAEGINIAYEFDPQVGNAEMDKQKCDIVLMNILINAIKHSTSGDTITIKTELTEDGFIRTSISDQGPGLGADVETDKIFTRFYQSRSEKYGSGIGLSYSKILVELHGGQIGVYNNDLIGATFWWEIPACAPGEGEIENRSYLTELLGHSNEAEDTSQDEIFNTSGMTVMLVDDNQDLLDFLREAMCGEFADIITITGGREAMGRLVSGKLPDIIVSDVNMPDGDGFWLCKEIKDNEKFSHIPLVLLTARGDDHSQSESYRIGADSFLAKPFEVDTLVALIRGLLKRKSDIKKKYLDNEDLAAADYGSNKERFIIQLNKIIADNMSNPALDQRLICQELGVSRALLYNKMKAITGAGAKEYITKIRIERAKALMESTSLTIAEISDMTGFTSQSYFSTAFKHYTGVTPSQYKQNNTKQKSRPCAQGRLTYDGAPSGDIFKI